jgi:membrane protease YdiL (CAAX protease family)
VTALIIAAVLIAYPNGLALLSARYRWDQWRAFMIGNALLGLALLGYTLNAGLWAAVWGHVTGGGLALGLVVGLIPLAVILAAMFAPGPLGRDIVASGIGDISTNHVIFRITVQVALSTVVCEEFLFRGLLQVLLTQGTTPYRAVLLGGVVFGLWHIALQYNGFSHQRGRVRWAATAGGTGAYALLGVLLAAVRQAADGLLAAVVAHGILDVCMFIGMYVRRRQLAR